MRRLPLVVSLMLLATPLLAAPPSAPSPTLVTLADIFAPAPMPTAGSGQGGSGIPEPGISSTCTANCWDGSTRTCTGTSCSAVNSNCSAGQRGSCTAGGSTTFCPACPTAKTCTATCSPSGSVSCTSPVGDCYKVNNCYAYCDGIYYWCPSHGACPV